MMMHNSESHAHRETEAFCWLGGARQQQAPLGRLGAEEVVRDGPGWLNEDGRVVKGQQGFDGGGLVNRGVQGTSHAF